MCISKDQHKIIIARQQLMQCIWYWAESWSANLVYTYVHVLRSCCMLYSIHRKSFTEIHTVYSPMYARWTLKQEVAFYLMKDFTIILGLFSLELQTSTANLSRTSTKLYKLLFVQYVYIFASNPIRTKSLYQA